MVRLLIFLLLWPLALAAETPISPQEFERIVTGKTYSYANGGVAYGAETYFDNRRVRWSFLDGKCTDGEWYVSGQMICFIYEDIPDPQCWQFYLRGGRISARFQNDPTSTELYETKQSDEPLYCLGPEVGV